MQTDTISPTVSPAVMLPPVGDNAYILETKHGPVLVFSRRDSLSLPMPQK